MGLTYIGKITVNVAKSWWRAHIKTSQTLYRISFKPVMNQGIESNEMAKFWIKFHRENSYNTLMCSAACLRYTNTNYNFSIVEKRAIIWTISVIYTAKLFRRLCQNCWQKWIQDFPKIQCLNAEGVYRKYILIKKEKYIRVNIIIYI
jgi:hypothetical protein